MRLIITSKAGVVHRVLGEAMTCAAALRAERQIVVSLAQCMVFKLPCCSQCFPSRDIYRRMVGG
jgi:hypothetical protein